MRGPIVWALSVPSAADLDYWAGLGASAVVIDTQQLPGMGNQHGATFDSIPAWRELPTTAARAAARGLDVFVGWYLEKVGLRSKPFAEWDDDAGWATAASVCSEAAHRARVNGVKGVALDGELYHGGEWGYTGQEVVRARGAQISRAILDGWSAVLKPLVLTYGLGSHVNGWYAERTIWPGGQWDSEAFLNGLTRSCSVVAGDETFYKSTHSGEAWDVAIARANGLVSAKSLGVDGYTAMCWLDSIPHDPPQPGEWSQIPPSVEQLRWAQMLAVNTPSIWYVWGGDGTCLPADREATVRTAMSLVSGSVPPVVPPVEPPSHEQRVPISPTAQLVLHVDGGVTWEPVGLPLEHGGP